MEYLGLAIDSIQMTLSLIEKKVKGILQECKIIFSMKELTVLQLTQLVGLLSSTIQAFPLAQIQFPYLQLQQVSALKGGMSYKDKIVLNNQALVERKPKILQWEVSIIINSFFFVDIIQHLKILQIVFRPKKLIKANYKPSKMKVLKYTFQQSFKLQNYWEEKKNTHTIAHIFACTHKRTHAYTYTDIHIG